MVQVQPTLNTLLGTRRITHGQCMTPWNPLQYEEAAASIHTTATGAAAADVPRTFRHRWTLPRCRQTCSKAAAHNHSELLGTTATAGSHLLNNTLSITVSFGAQRSRWDFNQQVDCSWMDPSPHGSCLPLCGVLATTVPTSHQTLGFGFMV